MKNNEKFTSPKFKEKMTVEQAFDYLESAVVDHHNYIYDDIYDFARTLVTKCNVDPEYVLANLKTFVSRYCYNDPNKQNVIEEVKNNIVKEGIIDFDDFEQKLAALKKKDIEEELRKEAIKKASDRHEQLKGLKRIVADIKNGKFNEEMFDGKTIDEIENMYQPSPKRR